MRTAWLPAIAILFTLCANAQAAPVDPVNFSESVYVSDGNIGFTTGIDRAPDGSGRLFVIRKGRFGGIQPAEVRIVQNGALLPTPFATETVYTSSECGLIGMGFDPDPQISTQFEEFVNNIGSHVDMTTGPDGALYYANQSSPGTIRRLAYTPPGGPQQNIIVQPTAFNVLEGGSSIFSVRLNSAPVANVNVTVSRLSGDTDLTVSSGAFTPANFNVPQLVTIAATEDADTANDSAVFRVSAAGIATYDLTVNGIDTPPPPLNVVSRKIHGAAGMFDINLPLTGSPGVECRSGGATGDYQLVITFANSVTVNGTVQAKVTSVIPPETVPSMVPISRKQNRAAAPQ